MRKEPSKIIFVILILLYIAASFIVIRFASDRGVIMLAGNSVPITAFAGVFSSLANICIIFLVVYFKKRGFIVSLYAPAPVPYMDNQYHQAS